MQIIEINIGNKSYKISCTIGEEDKVRKLATRLNKRYKKLEGSLGNKASADMILVIIGLMLEDEVSSLASGNDQNNLNKSTKIKELSNKIDKIVDNLSAAQ